jgi:hypothetical protein
MDELLVVFLFSNPYPKDDLEGLRIDTLLDIDHLDRDSLEGIELSIPRSHRPIAAL